MTLYDLANTTTIQGNIEIKIFNADGIETECRFYRDQDDFNPLYNDCDDVEEYEVSYIYPRKSADGTTWLTIEIVLDE